MSDPVVTAAVPSLIATLQAVKTFLANMGTDPAQMPAKFPGAVQVLMGTIELQFPALVVADVGALQNDANAKIDAWIVKLQSVK